MSGFIRLYTVQAPGAAQWANEHGYFAGLEEHLWPRVLRAKSPEGDWSHIFRAYNWIKAEASRRIPNFSGRWPIWCDFRRPDLRASRWSWGGNHTILLLITARVPRERVLPFSCHGWHLILNGSPVMTDEEFDRYPDTRFWSNWSQERIEESWPRIFDPEFGDLDEAIADRIYLNEVVDVKAFQTRLRAEERKRRGMGD